jgi:hypothetical protein
MATFADEIGVGLIPDTDFVAVLGSLLRMSRSEDVRHVAYFDSEPAITTTEAYMHFARKPDDADQLSHANAPTRSRRTRRTSSIRSRSYATSWRS